MVKIIEKIEQKYRVLYKFELFRIQNSTIQILINIKKESVKINTGQTKYDQK